MEPTTFAIYKHATTQREALAACQPGAVLRISNVGGGGVYTIKSIRGEAARELELEGVRGAKRWLIDGGDRFWLRDPTAAKRKGRNESGGHRRVLSIQVVSRPSRMLEEVVPARMRMPDGYKLGVTANGYVAVHDDPYVAGRLNAVPDEVGQPTHNVHAAVLDAWEDALLGKQDELDRAAAHNLELDRQLSIATAERDRLQVDVTRLRIALQQLSELARGVERSNEPLVGPPERVVSELGHALRVESVRGRAMF